MAKKIGIRVMIFAMVIFVCGFAATASAATSGAEQFIGRLPDETIGFVATSGGDELKPAFEKTNLGKMWNDPNVQTFVKSIKSEIVNKIRAEISDANNTKIFDDAANFADLLLKRPIVIGAGIDKSVKESPLYGFAIIDVSSRQLEIAKAVIRFESLAPKGAIVDVNVSGQKMHWFADAKEEPGYWGFVGDYLVFAINDRGGHVIKNLRGNRSGTAVNYLAGVEGTDDAFVLYADFQRIAEFVKTIAQQEKGQEGLDKIKMVSAVMKELGLADVKSIKARFGFSGPDVVGRELIEIPLPRTGIPARLKTIDLSIFNLADLRSVNAAAFNVDLGGIYDTVMSSIRIASPNDVYPDVNEAIKGLESKIDFSIRNDLLAGLAGPIIVYSVPEGVLSDIPSGGAVLIAKTANAQTIEKSLKSLGNFAAGDSNNIVKDSNNVVKDSNAVKYSNNAVQVRAQEQNGRTYYTFAMLPFAAMQILPTWTITDSNYLVVATNQPLCAKAVARITGADRSDSIRMTAGFKKAVEGFRSEPINFRYTDSQVQFNQLLKVAQQCWPMITMGAAGAGFKLPLTLPSLQHLTEQMGSTVQYSYYDGKGLHINYRGSGMEVGVGVAAGIGGGMGILMPALARTRQIAQSTVSGSHLAGIGKAMFIYANDNNDVYPPDLKTLVEKEDLSPKSLESSRKPKDFNGPSFIYITGQNPKMNSGNVLVYENPEFCRDGVNVLYNDGHVAFERWDDFKKAIEETYKRLNKSMPEIKFGK
jgi:prepilin-type processing-associated H-X9-DG protein